MDRDQRKGNGAHPTLVRRGCAALGCTAAELALALSYRAVRMRWASIPAADIPDDGCIAFGDDGPLPPRSKELERAVGRDEVLASWATTLSIVDAVEMGEHLPAHAESVLAAVAGLPSVPENAPGDDVAGLAAEFMDVKRRYIAFSVLCAAVDSLTSVLGGEESYGCKAFDLLIHDARWRGYHRMRRGLWRLHCPAAYKASAKRASRKWNASATGKRSKREWMAARRADPSYKEAEKARRRQRYSARKGATS